MAAKSTELTETIVSAPATEPPDGGAVELIISWLLRIGVWSSISIIIIGLVMLLITDRSTLLHRYPGGVNALLKPHPNGIADQPNPFKSYADVLLSIRRGEAYGVITLGLLVLLLTPVLRVAVSIVAFAIERDRLYVLITSCVLLLLLAGIVFGKAGG
ncbi:MAG: DUF1634 domain-containing protein [Dehalococcoidia bacterium]